MIVNRQDAKDANEYCSEYLSLIFLASWRFNAVT